MSLEFRAFEYKEVRTSIPEPKQFRIGPNPNYLDSLMAGVFSPILHLPQILWFGSIWPFIKSLFGGVYFILTSMVMGLLGRANGIRIVEIEPKELTQAEKQKALDEMLAGSGFKAVPLSELYGAKHASGEH
jgi:hypothetical protein